MQIDCEQIVEKYMLNKNPLYAFNFPISMLVAIIVFGFAKAYSWFDNSYINQILLPILSLLLSFVIIDIFARWMISKEEKKKWVELCKNSFGKKNIENFTIQTNTYNQKEKKKQEIKEQQNINNIPMKNIHSESEKEIISSSPEISVLQPLGIEYATYNSVCIQNSDCCQLCSGSTDQNPCNLIAPIPGPQWLPQNAEAVQKRLSNNDYTLSKCIL